jgi:hypothetical protein
MIGKLRRFEILLRLQFNDGREIPAGWLAESVFESENRTVGVAACNLRY